MAIFCNNCGKQLAPSDKFCQNCATPIQGQVSSQNVSAALPRWENRRIHIDFNKITVPRSSLPRHTSIMHDPGGPEVTLVNVRWTASKSVSRDFLQTDPRVQRFYAGIWNFISPVLEQKINEIAADGWELMASMSSNMLDEVYIDHGMMSVLAVVGALFTFGVSLLLLIPPSFYVYYTGAHVPMRRSMSG